MAGCRAVPGQGVGPNELAETGLDPARAKLGQ